MNAPKSPTAKYFRVCTAARVIRNVLLTFIIACLTACASTEENHRTPTPTAAEAAKLIGCRADEVALCIEINCELEDWRCTERDEVRDMFKAGDFTR